jgi:hypothetical protein
MYMVERLKNKLSSIEQELQQAKTVNAAPACYINAKRKKKEDRRNEEARKKAEEGQSSKDPFPPAS